MSSPNAVCLSPHILALPLNPALSGGCHEEGSETASPAWVCLWPRCLGVGGRGHRSRPWGPPPCHPDQGLGTAGDSSATCRLPWAASVPTGAQSGTGDPPGHSVRSPWGHPTREAMSALDADPGTVPTQETRVPLPQPRATRWSRDLNVPRVHDGRVPTHPAPCLGDQGHLGGPQCGRGSRPCVFSLTDKMNTSSSRS